jgi:hypothetical protein
VFKDDGKVEFCLQGVRYCKCMVQAMEQNYPHSEPGGLPAYNNGVEGINNGDKVAFDNRKPVTCR